MHLSIHKCAQRLLSKVGFRDANWGDWRGLASPEQDPRYRQIYSWINTFVPGASILDLGCGEAILLRKIHSYAQGTTPARPLGRYFGVELSTEAVARARENAGLLETETVVQGDITDLSLIGGKAFDLVIFNEVLYYLQDPVPRSLRLIDEYAAYATMRGMFLVSIWHNTASPKPDNEAVWAAVAEKFEASRAAYSFVPKDQHSGWHMGLYDYQKARAQL
jgi:SAM-dependent methyltransferase